MPALWQGDSEQRWRLGRLVPPADLERIWTRELDFVWVAPNDIRRLKSCDHHGKLCLYGTREEVDRLGPALVDLLNENRASDQCLRAVGPAAVEKPIDVLLRCPTCHAPHVDEPTPGWANPPHRSHLCGACGTSWRPADVATNGVRTIATRGKSDTHP
jgi:hypothetical protein